MSQIIAADMNVEFDTTNPAETANFLLKQDAGRTKDHPVFVHVIREKPGHTFAGGFITAVEAEFKKLRPHQDVFIVKQAYTFPIVELPANAVNTKKEANDAVMNKAVERLYGPDACGGPGCGKTDTDEGGALAKCSGCTVRLYCGKKCQKKHWKIHKKVCWIFKVDAGAYLDGGDDREDILRQRRPDLILNRLIDVHHGEGSGEVSVCTIPKSRVVGEDPAMPRVGGDSLVVCSRHDDDCDALEVAQPPKWTLDTQDHSVFLPHTKSMSGFCLDYYIFEIRSTAVCVGEMLNDRHSACEGAHDSQVEARCSDSYVEMRSIFRSLIDRQKRLAGTARIDLHLVKFWCGASGGDFDV
ncbi:hypothetical protein LTR37_001447 [Vermiconidia calcicola]|uniref:Uncharacterized protein n=1 Tax=Vermiconidia calcicola TaxID=1690605 RepID=A0ACC3NXJ3_9PEZI|nr:hypothetical protein LTR37_001447 [Vermiconidia calcicola]